MFVLHLFSRSTVNVLPTWFGQRRLVASMLPVPPLAGWWSAVPPSVPSQVLEVDGDDGGGGGVDQLPGGHQGDGGARTCREGPDTACVPRPLSPTAKGSWTARTRTPQ